MHRHTGSRGRASAGRFHGGALAEGMPIAIDAIETGYREMIDPRDHRRPRQRPACASSASMKAVRSG